MKNLLSYALPTFVQSVRRSGPFLWSGTNSWMEP
jgi:hypothetical protein